jgi:hypothetical protein
LRQRHHVVQLLLAQVRFERCDAELVLSAPLHKA